MSRSRSLHDGTPPAGALTTIYSAASGECSTGSLRYSTSTCMPSNFSAYWGRNVGYYSPAICPSGYGSAGVPASGFGPGVESSETAMVCCPSGYTYSAKSNCYAIATYTSTATSTGSSLSVTAGVTATVPVTQTITSTGSSWAYPIQVRWAATDLPNLETDPLIPGKRPGVTNATSSTISKPTTTPIKGLTTGQKVGIGVGAAIGGLVLFVIAAFFLLRFLRRHSKKNTSPSAGDQNFATSTQTTKQQPLSYPNKENLGKAYTTNSAGDYS